MPQVSILIYFVITLALSLAGQALLKKGVMTQLAGATPSMAEFLRYHLLPLALSRHVVVGVVLCGLGVISWVYVLSRFELSRALPIMGGLAYISLFFIGRVFLREPTSWLNFGGILLITAGLYLVSLKAT
jgi:multidrug transporter EmrE-like cation transporter